MENLVDLENSLWDAADELRANSGLRAADYSTPVLGLLFLRYADHRFSQAERELEGKGSTRRPVGKDDYIQRVGFFVPKKARFRDLVNLEEGEDVGKAVNEAMKAMERENISLQGTLPTSYNKIENQTLIALLRVMNSIPMDLPGDAFGKIYEYFLGKFAMSEGQKGGEFYTPTSIVELIVNIVEPFDGRILDPACGSGGMFVQSARFVEEHKGSGHLSIVGQEKSEHTVRLAKMNLAVHGLEGTIKEGNSYYEPLYQKEANGKGFDYVMANPPFNVDSIRKEQLQGDKETRFPYGLPTVDNGNYIWIQMFASALNDRGRAGFVMANSASDARGSELEIRRKMIEDGIVDVMVAISSNFFYTVTLPCTLWFLDKGKRGTKREDQILFIDARHTYRQVNRRIRDFEPAQMEFLSNIVRLYRGEAPENMYGSTDLMQEHFPSGTYADVAGLCKVASRADVEASGWSLNPGRYVGVTQVDGVSDADFVAEMERFQEEFEALTVGARGLEDKISSDLNWILGGE